MTNNNISPQIDKNTQLYIKPGARKQNFGIASNNMITISENVRISLNPCPHGLTTAYETLFCDGLLRFLTELVTTFDSRCDKLLWKRQIRKYNLKVSSSLPVFNRTRERDDERWKIREVPERLLNRRLDLGDVSPANSEHFLAALRANVQGIQVDFDDGHCPTWKNQIIGLYNVYRAVHGKIDGITDLNKCPVLMLRPRAWNMIEHNVFINGKKVAGPLFDFAVLMYHNAKILAGKNSGPFFYLSKLEGAEEAKLWNDIFTWSQEKLGIPHGTIKACVLIENILSSFEMDEILYALRDHSLGLNCGIWDYAASIIAKFGDRKEFLLPDRNKYVNMQRHFLKKYMELVIQTCHKRGAHATGGMAALLVDYTRNPQMIIEKVTESKKAEIIAGVDGFMVYDLKLVPYMNKLWDDMCGPYVNQISNKLPNETITPYDLLKTPSEGVTLFGLKHNIKVAILFLYNWLNGVGHFALENCVEDSATAEISRSQIWQWIRHKAVIEDTGAIVTKKLVQSFAEELVVSLQEQTDKRLLFIALRMFYDIITALEFPDFITTYLNDSLEFQAEQKQLLSKL